MRLQLLNIWRSDEGSRRRESVCARLGSEGSVVLQVPLVGCEVALTLPESVSEAVERLGQERNKNVTSLRR